MKTFIRTLSECIALFTLLLFAISGFADSPAETLLRNEDAWFQTDEGRMTLENILSWQTEHGDWPKNLDTTDHKFSGLGTKPAGTFDNSATIGELRVLARAYRLTGDERYRESFLRGFDHILKAQYAHGGWPQFYPLSTGYHRHVTFNDGTMIRLMEFLRDTTRDDEFRFLGANRHQKAQAAVQRGVECILKCQVIVNETRTVWCAQHDADTLEPVLARSYELPSLSGAESAGVLRFLMSIDNPSPEIIRAINAGAEWFDAVKIEGYRYRKSKTEPALTPDPGATPIWARFYEIETNRPMFCDRDGIVKYDLDQIGGERRGGYTWYGSWGVNILKEHAKWLKDLN